MTERESTVVLITGASSGIGRACATYLAQQGYQVYGTSRRPRQDGLPFAMLQMDVTDDASVQQAIQTILEQQGRVDVVINNAGIGYGGAVEDTSIEAAQATLEIDSRASGFIKPASFSGIQFIMLDLIERANAG